MLINSLKSRIGKQFGLTFILLIASFLLYFFLPSTFSPKLSFGFILISSCSFLLVWFIGVSVPFLGRVSMERMIQIFLVLSISYHHAAIINAIAAFVWPLIKTRHSIKSFSLSLLSSSQNAAIAAFTMLLCGFILSQLIMSLPLIQITDQSIYAVIIFALTVQLFNFVMISILYSMEGKRIWNHVSYLSLFTEALFLPLGVLAALLYNNHLNEAFVTLILAVLAIGFAFYANLFNKRDDIPLKHIMSIGYDHNNFKAVLEDLSKKIVDQFKFNSFYVVMCDLEREINDPNKIDMVYQQHKQRRYPMSLDNDDINFVTNTQSILLKQYTNPDTKLESSMMMAPMINHKGVFAFIVLQENFKNAYIKTDLTHMGKITDQYSMLLSYVKAYDLIEHKQY